MNLRHWQSLSVLLALRDFCLAERVLKVRIGLGGHRFNIHPELSAISLRFNDARVSSSVQSREAARTAHALAAAEAPLRWE